jgi:heptosyltransferase-2
VRAGGGAAADAVALPLGDVAALLARCRRYIGNDTGVLNMAAALGVPVIGLFGGSRPLWHSRFIHPLLPPSGEHGMAAITVHQVLEAFMRLGWLNANRDVA